MRFQIVAAVTVVIVWQLQLVLARPGRRRCIFREPKYTNRKWRLNNCDDCAKSFKLVQNMPYNFKFGGADYKYALVSSCVLR